MPKLSQSCLKVVPNCQKVVPKLSKSSPKTFKKLCQSYPKTVTKLALSCPKLVLVWLPYRSHSRNGSYGQSSIWQMLSYRWVQLLWGSISKSVGLGGPILIRKIEKILIDRKKDFTLVPWLRCPRVWRGVNFPAENPNTFNRKVRSKNPSHQQMLVDKILTFQSHKYYAKIATNT